MVPHRGSDIFDCFTEDPLRENYTDRETGELIRGPAMFACEQPAKKKRKRAAAKAIPVKGQPRGGKRARVKAVQLPSPQEIEEVFGGDAEALDPAPEEWQEGLFEEEDEHADVVGAPPSPVDGWA